MTGILAPLAVASLTFWGFVLAASAHERVSRGLPLFTRGLAPVIDIRCGATTQRRAGMPHSDRRRRHPRRHSLRERPTGLAAGRIR